ncbi:fatty-acyl coenzyme A oxidase [Quaeritorhiza haematococci]|nr:fatty-acyl coenzyme A oxidase [Quaeritorhiza haematococci]
MSITKKPANDRLNQLNAHLAGPVQPPTPMQTIATERQNPSFPVRNMTYLLDGGEENTKLKEKIMLQLERDPVFKVSDYHELPYQVVRERTMAKVARCAYYIANEPVAQYKMRTDIIR